jgi:hypothetical protein
MYYKTSIIEVNRHSTASLLFYIISFTCSALEEDESRASGLSNVTSENVIEDEMIWASNRRGRDEKYIHHFS